MSEKISPIAEGIVQGLKEAISDVNGEQVKGLKKSVVYRVQPRLIREQLNMSQKEFSVAFGIPLSTLQNWEQGRRKIDGTATSYLKAIMMYPKEMKTANMISQ